MGSPFGGGWGIAAPSEPPCSAETSSAVPSELASCLQSIAEGWRQERGGGGGLLEGRRGLSLVASPNKGGGEGQAGSVMRAIISWSLI